MLKVSGLFKEFNTFILLGHITLIKSHSKDIYNATKTCISNKYCPFELYSNNNSKELNF